MHKLVLVVAPAKKREAVIKAAETAGATHMVTGTTNEIENADDKRAIWLSAPPTKRQALLDMIQAVLGPHKDWQLFILPTEAELPLPEEAVKEKGSPAKSTREELYSQIKTGMTLDRNFILLVVLSTLVAAVGLMENNLAAIIGAMVIAPLLGPNLAMILGAAMGDWDLIKQSLKTLAVGFILAVSISVLIGYGLPLDYTSHELMSRAQIGIDGIVVALASGAAAALSLISGLSATLVGVMVAVALLPPLVAFGLFLGAGQEMWAAGAYTVFLVNVVSVNLAGQIVFLSRGVKPRRGQERRDAQKSLMIMLSVWFIGLMILGAVVIYTDVIQTLFD